MRILNTESICMYAYIWDESYYVTRNKGYYVGMSLAVVQCVKQGQNVSILCEILVYSWSGPLDSLQSNFPKQSKIDWDTCFTMRSSPALRLNEIFYWNTRSVTTIFVVASKLDRTFGYCTFWRWKNEETWNV